MFVVFLDVEKGGGSMVFFNPIAMGSNTILFLIHALFLLLLSAHTCHGVESDIQCLKTVKAQLVDPNKYLDSWIFDNMTEGFICKFTGIDCWHNDESRVINIRLSNMGLQGQFPLGLMNCTSMAGLDLSANDLSGALPLNIDHIIPFVTTLDLSSNNFSNAIPPQLGNITFLNDLSLQHNQFSGLIPWQLTRLPRLRLLNVLDNSLSGQIPAFSKNILQASNFMNNNGLCGQPLEPCKGLPGKSHTGVIIGAAIGGIILAIIVIAVVLLFAFPRVSKKKKDEDLEGNKWAKNIKGTKGIKVSVFQKSVPKMRLFNLMKATDNFSKNNIIGSGKTGTIYRAILSNGSPVAVKRLQESFHSDVYFISEMKSLASIRHPNLVPLLGFCIARKERLLIFEYMPNGTLYQKLHQAKSEAISIDWALRLRIGTGVARGLVWLHHHCNPHIIHRNISTKCILLDDNYEAKISDFGFARLVNPDDSHLTISFDGNFDDWVYFAPEYPITMVATPKGDVYSFGMLLLELITGKRPAQVAYALRNNKDDTEGWIAYLLNKYYGDKSLAGKLCDGDIFRVLKLAFACIVPAPEDRPTMREVYQQLRTICSRYNIVEDDEMQTLMTDAANSFPYRQNTVHEIQMQEFHV